ncbi:MAG: response regulator [Gammaproteobacteria bacterium]|nr:response regulator [Gammaproteobacteria bacterium]
MKAEHSERVLIIAPLGRDAAAIASVLDGAGYAVKPCVGAAEATASLAAGAGALLLTEESLDRQHMPQLLSQLRAQPAWSELPVIILTSGGEARFTQLLDLTAAAAGSVTVLERPLSPATLLRSIEVALRSRRRQYHVRDLLESQQQREAALAASEERWRLALEGADLGSWDVDLATGVTVWNRRHGELLGYPPESGATTMERWRERVDERDLDRVELAITKARRERAAFTVEHRLHRADTGELRWLALYGRFHYDAAGMPVRFSGVSRDVTEHKRLEEEREGYLAALQEADRRKDTFLATLSHELRNPLAPIRNAAEVLTSAKITPMQLRWAQSVIRRQVTHMAWLLDDLLDLARITQGKLRLRRQPCTLRSVVEAALETSRPFLDRKDHKLTILLPEKNLTLHADPLRLAQVLSNLLTNAAKYTDAGGHIELAARVEDELILSVKDDGIGIPAEQLHRLFTMFSQVSPSSTRAEGGLGIGLALVKGLMDLHGGSVEARSGGIGTGSEFIVRMPLIELESDTPDTRAAELPTSMPDKLRVLIADDNQDAAESLAMLLSLEGCEVRTAYDGQAAVSLAQLFRPQVALLDIAMPKLDGYATARALRQQRGGGELCLIALTGRGQDQDKRETDAAGFAAHLTKPVDPARLRSILTQARDGVWEGNSLGER